MSPDCRTTPADRVGVRLAVRQGWKALHCGEFPWGPGMPGGIVVIVPFQGQFRREAIETVTQQQGIEHAMSDLVCHWPFESRRHFRR